MDANWYLLATKQVDCSVIPPIGNSDHLSVHLTIRNQRSAKCTGPSRSIWRYSAADWDRACELLNSIDWNEFFSGDINHAWTLWEHKFMSVMEECIPRVKLTKRCNLPWLSKNLKRAMQKRNHLFRRSRRTGSARLMNLYRLKRNEVTKLLRSSKEAYFRKLKPNSKQFWKTVRLLKGDNKTIPTLVVNDHEVTSDSDKVEVLSDHFVKSFNNSLPPLSPMDVQSIVIDPNSCPEQLLSLRKRSCLSSLPWMSLRPVGHRGHFSSNAQGHSSSNYASSDQAV